VPLASAPLASAPASAPTTSFGASTQEAFAAPSSNPIDSGAADASQLIWRSPGTRY
jgi:hypothetical protein